MSLLSREGDRAVLEVDHNVAAKSSPTRTVYYGKIPVNSFEQRQKALADALAHRILVLDGAMGTMLQDRNLTAADFGGPALEGCNEYLVKTRPDVIGDIHRAYLRAGSDIIETNTFGGTAVVLAEYHVEK